MALTPTKDIFEAFRNGKTVLVIIEHDAVTLEPIMFKNRREYREWLQEKPRGYHVAFSIRELIGAIY